MRPGTVGHGRRVKATVGSAAGRLRDAWEQVCDLLPGRADLVTARRHPRQNLIAGLTMAVVLTLRSVARSARLQPVALDLGDHSEEEHALLREHIVALRLDGPLFFAAAHHFLLELSEVADVRVVILRMSRISAIDATGAQVLADAITRLERRSITVLISGISSEHDGVLTALGVATHLRRDGLIFPDTPAAIRYARTLVGIPPGTPIPYQHMITAAPAPNGSKLVPRAAAHPAPRADREPTMAVLRGEQARRAYARAQQREQLFPPEQDEPDRQDGAAITSQRPALSSAHPDAPVQVQVRARWARRWTYQNSYRGSECP